jgi:hypothetical protein
MEAALFSTNYTNITNGFRKYIDIPTFVRHFLVGEISGNTDTYWSVYLSKKRGDDKFYFGPVWDFDLAFENDGRTYPINEKKDWICLKAGSFANGMHDYVSRWLSDANLYSEITNVYASYRDNDQLHPDSLLAVIDHYAAEMDASQDLNFKRWDILGRIEHQNWQASGSYAAEVAILKNYLSDRIAWMDNKLQYVSNPPVYSEFEDVLIYSAYNTLYINNLKERTKITCFDISGRIIFENFSENNFNKQLSKGIYLIKLENKKGNKQVFKCIVS